MLQVTPVKWDSCLRLVVIDTLEIVRGSASLLQLQSLRYTEMRSCSLMQKPPDIAPDNHDDPAGSAAAELAQHWCGASWHQEISGRALPYHSCSDAALLPQCTRPLLIKVN